MTDDKYTPDTPEVKRSFVLNLTQLVDAEFTYEQAAEAFERWYQKIYDVAYDNGYETGYDNGSESGYESGYLNGYEAGADRDD